MYTIEPFSGELRNSLLRMGTIDRIKMVFRCLNVESELGLRFYGTDELVQALVVLHSCQPVSFGGVVVEIDFETLWNNTPDYHFMVQFVRGYDLTNFEKSCAFLQDVLDRFNSNTDGSDLYIQLLQVNNGVFLKRVSEPKAVTNVTLDFLRYGAYKSYAPEIIRLHYTHDRSDW